MTELLTDFLAAWGIAPYAPVESEIDVLRVSLAQFHCKPQLGTPTRMTWGNLSDFLSCPVISADKEIAGGYSPALYRSNHRAKSDLIVGHALAMDVDGDGDVDHVADLVRGYRTIVHETFSSTPDDPRCRVLFQLAEPIDVATYERLHAIARELFRAAGITKGLDGAKDASRLSYCPVRRPGSGYRFRTTDGTLLDARRVIAAQPKPVAIPRSVVSASVHHSDKYRRGALRRAADALALAPAGSRHETLNREAYALARLDLSISEIAGALLPTAVAVMGDARRREAERTIADAVRARKVGA